MLLLCGVMCLGLSVLSFSAFAEAEDGEETVAVASVYDELQAAIESNAANYTLAGDLTISSGQSVNTRITAITVPASTTLRVNGTLTAFAVVVEEGGAVVIGDGGQFELSGRPDITDVDGTITLAGVRSRLDFQPAHWTNIKDSILVTGENAEIHINAFYNENSDFNTSLSNLRNIVIPAGLADYVQKEFNIQLPWTPEDGYVLDNSVNWRIQNARGEGSLTVAEGNTVTVSGYLCLHDATATVNGTLVNNGQIDLREEAGTMSRIILNGRYTGNGELAVRNLVNPESYLEGFDANGLEETGHDEDRGIIYYVYTADILTLPSALTIIESEAFAGISAEKVVVPDGCRSIATGAFSSCPNLREISIPSTCTLEDNAVPSAVTIIIR